MHGDFAFVTARLDGCKFSVRGMRHRGFRYHLQLLYQALEVACVVSRTHCLVYDLKNRAAIRTSEPRSFVHNLYLFSIIHGMWYVPFARIASTFTITNKQHILPGTAYTAYYQARLSLSTRSCVYICEVDMVQFSARR